VRSDRRQIPYAGQVEERPVRLSPLYRNEEAPVLFRHLAHDFADEILACLQKLIERHRDVDHSLESALVFGGDVAQHRRQNFRHRAGHG
jgi:hypothetical protein